MPVHPINKTSTDLQANNDTTFKSNNEKCGNRYFTLFDIEI